MDRIAPTAAATAFLVVLGALLGGALLAGLPAVTGWLLSLPWIPMRGPLELLAGAAAYASWWVLGLVGLLLGAVLGYAASTQSVVVSLDERELVITEGARRTRLARSQVHHVVQDGRRLSLRDAHDVDLASPRIDGEPAELTAALRRHGWPV